MPPPHPLRRVSTGSLSSLARSQDRTRASPSGLDFLAPALTDLADEASTLAVNTQKLNELHDALGTFNEAFAGWMYALKMNAFCVEWPEGESMDVLSAGTKLIMQAPVDISFQRIPKFEAAAAQAAAAAEAAAALAARNASSAQHHLSQSRLSEAAHDYADATYATIESNDEPAPPPQAKPKAGVNKPAAGASAGAGAGKKSAAATASAKRKRDLEVAGYIEMLPLEYRGQEPAMRLGMEKVINKLLNQPAGYTLPDLVSAPDLTQPKVNRHLMALVARKLVSKTSQPGGKAVYQWNGAL